jgi:anti-sigma B factor antagonist
MDVDGEFRVLDYQRDDAHRLALTGELDLVSAPALIEIAAALCRDGARQLLLDISELAFADSTGLRALLSVETLCAEHCCEFSLTRGTEQLERLFEIMRLFQDLPLRAEPDGAKQRPVVLWPRPVELTGSD